MNYFNTLHQHFTSALRRVPQFRRRGRSETPLQEVRVAPENQARTCGAQSRPPPPVARCVAHVSEYCRSTSIHGLSYIGDGHRPIAERLLWVILLATSLALCSILIHKVWLKWERTPVIVTFVETATSVWEVPFPAVTICSETKSNKSAFNFGAAYKRKGDLPDDVLHKYADLSLVCGEWEPGIEEKSRNFTDQETVNFLKKVAPPMAHTIVNFGWRNLYSDDASEVFRQQMTEDGLCFTFNILDEEDIYTKEVVEVMKRNNGNEHLERRPSAWSAENGFEKGSGLDTHPARSLSPGRHNDLTVTLSVLKADIDYFCGGVIQGFKVVLHTPEEAPDMRSQYLRVPLGQAVTVAVQPQLLTTSEGLRYYLPHRRHCYFPSERRLRFFRTYTQSNCEIECLTNITLHRCNCVYHHMPRTEDTRICAMGKYSCYLDSIDERMRRKVLKNLNSDDDDTDPGPGDCDCLPSCTDLSFDVEIFQLDLDIEAYEKAHKDNTSMDNTTMEECCRLSVLSVYFKSSEFIPSRRSELYGVTDFIANCGGLLGLFMDFSLLSLVEILYFFSCRLGFSQLLKRSTKKRVVNP